MDRELQLSDFEPGELDGTVYAPDGDEAYCPSEDDDAVTAGSAYQQQLVWLRRFYVTVGLSKTETVCRRILDKRRHGEPAVSDECFSDMCKILEAKYMYKNHRQQLQWLVDFYARNDPNKDVSCPRILARRRGSAPVLRWKGFKKLRAELEGEYMIRRQRQWLLDFYATADSSKTAADCEVLLDEHRGDANAVTETDFAKLRGRLEQEYSKLAVNGGSV